MKAVTNLTLLVRLALLCAFALNCREQSTLAASPGATGTKGTNASSSANWPMFRGDPGLVGVANADLPDKPKLKWTFKSGAPVKSSAAVADGRVYIGSDDGSVYALDLLTGKKIWAYKTGGPVESSPLVLNGTVFVGSSDASLYALNATTGNRVWKYDTGDRILGAPNWVVRFAMWFIRKRWARASG